MNELPIKVINYVRALQLEKYKLHLIKQPSSALIELASRFKPAEQPESSFAFKATKPNKSLQIEIILLIASFQARGHTCLILWPVKMEPQGENPCPIQIDIAMDTSQG